MARRRRGLTGSNSPMPERPAITDYSGPQLDAVAHVEPAPPPLSLLEQAVAKLGLTLHDVKKYEQRGEVFEVTDQTGFPRIVRLKE